MRVVCINLSSSVFFYTPAPPAYCVSCKCRMYTLLWSWQHVEAVCSCNFSAKWVRQEAAEWFESGRCVGGLKRPDNHFLATVH